MGFKEWAAARDREMRWRRRAVLLVIGVVVCLHGAAALAKGNIDYANYWGGRVSAVVSPLVGVLIIAVALFGRLGRDASRKRRRPPGRPSPWDTFKKW